MPQVTVPYGQLVQSRPLLHGLAQQRIRVPAQIAVLQAIAALDAACAALDATRDQMIQAHLKSSEAPHGRVTLTDAGLALVRELERASVTLTVTQLEPKDFGDLVADGRDLRTLRWLVPFELETCPEPAPLKAEARPAAVPETEGASA